MFLVAASAVSSKQKRGALGVGVGVEIVSRMACRRLIGHALPSVQGVTGSRCGAEVEVRGSPRRWLMSSNAG